MPNARVEWSSSIYPQRIYCILVMTKISCLTMHNLCFHYTYYDILALCWGSWPPHKFSWAKASSCSSELKLHFPVITQLEYKIIDSTIYFKIKHHSEDFVKNGKSKTLASLALKLNLFIKPFFSFLILFYLDYITFSLLMYNSV